MSSPANAPAAQVNVVAFLSVTGGTGRTSAVANLAWVLSSAGQRVLVIDWGSEVPRIREYLEPFLVGELALPEALGRALLGARSVPSAADGRDEGDVLPQGERFALPRAEGHIDVIAPCGGAEPHPEIRYGDAQAVTELRARLAATDYDHVLVDAPTGAAPESLALLAALCDLAVVCFRPRPRAIADAADLATKLRRLAPIRIDLVPVATLFDDRDEQRAELTRARIRAAFADLLAGQPERVPGGIVEIPYRHYDAFDPLLVILAEEPEHGGGLETQYGRLAGAVTKGRVAGPPSVSPVVRARYRRLFRLESAERPDRFLIAYAAPDRAWADWVRGQLARVGAETRFFGREGAWADDADNADNADNADDVEPPGLVVVSSGHLAGSARLGELAGRLADGRQWDVLRLVVDDGAKPLGDVGAEVAVAGESEQTLRARVLTHFGLFDRPQVEHTGRMALPGRRPAVFGVPQSHPLFVGRDEDLERLRDRLTEPGHGRVVATLTGLPGIGKSELALEYACRFAGDYDLVWWVPADDPQSVRAALAGLGAKVGDPGQTGHTATSVLARLGNHPAVARFLLVYDNADDLDVLDGLLPQEHRGHVVITSNSPSADAPGAVELAEMAPDESARLLTGRVPGLSTEDALRVADAVDGLPLALHLAGAWLAETTAAERRAGASVADAATWSARAFLERLDTDPAPADDQEELPPRRTVRRVLAVLTATLRETSVGRIAVLLGQLCSFLSPQGVGLGLVRSTAMLDRLVAIGGNDAEPLRYDAGELDRALWTGARHGLFHVDWGNQNSLRLHRVVRAALRAGMSQAERDRRRADALTVLADFAPTEVEENAPGSRARFAELQNHVSPSGAVHSEDDAVRRWLVNQVRFLFTTGGAGVRASDLAPITELLDEWTARHGPDDPLRCRLAAQLANLHRVIGDRTEALRLDDSALAQQRRSLQLTHPQTLITARGRGGDLRGLGLFAEALEEDRTTWEGFREALGDDHPHTRMAANNLAVSLFLSGEVRDALAMEEDNYERRKRLFGENDQHTLWSLVSLGIYRREMGHYRLAKENLNTAAQRLRQLRPTPEAMELAARWHLAITLRREGDAKRAKGHNSRNRKEYEERLGPHHPDTLACTLSLAADHRVVGAEPAFAVELAQTALNGFRERVRLTDEHPFVALCRVGLGLALCAAGEGGEAAVQTRAGWSILRAGLGDAHPWTLAAAVDHARVTAACGDRGQAAELVSSALDACVEFLGVGHPHTKAARHNLRLAKDPAGRPDEGEWREIDVDIPQT